MRIISYILRIYIISFLGIALTYVCLNLKPKVKNKQINHIYTETTSSINAQFIQGNVEKYHNQSFIKIMSVKDMETLLGGCSGGTCQNYSHTCDGDCTHLNAKKCAGSSGSCANDHWIVLCRCDSGYIYTKGCM